MMPNYAEARPELARVHADVLRSNLGHLHHLEQTRELVRRDPDLLLESMERYIDIFCRALFPWNLERETIRIACEKLGKSKHKSAYETLEYLRGDENRFADTARLMIDPGSFEYRNAAKELANTMTDAWVPYLDRWELIDDHPDPVKREIIDRMRFGHTGGAVDGNIDINFYVLHNIGTFLKAHFQGTKFSNLVDYKDWHFGIMESRMILDTLAGPSPYQDHFINLWMKKRPYGLGWLKAQKLAAFKEAHEEVMRRDHR